MSISGKRVLTSEQVDAYQGFGFVHSVPILTPEEVRYYRDHLERTWSAIGGRITRADGLHLFFRWAWDLATHPRLLDCLEDLSARSSSSDTPGSSISTARAQHG